MSVTEAAKRLGVGRPALSNLLNGNAALSPEMAANLERVFGVEATTLLSKQAAHEIAAAPSPNVGSYVPPYMQLKAKDIEDWTREIASRQKLAVLLRHLIHSTGLGLTKVDFPGNDNSERPGWDGEVEADVATPFIPAGRSVWEFGTSEDAGDKANTDYAKSLKAMPLAADRAETTFVFVTPRQWTGKKQWVARKQALGHWKNVIAYDSDNLEQWLEQSIPAQVWFAHERKLSSEGVCSLDYCWEYWQADCSPSLHPSLFDEALKAVLGNLEKNEQENIEVKRDFIRRLEGGGNEPILISADSKAEALAFLHCLFNMPDPRLISLRDRVVVFTQTGPLARLGSKDSTFIPVITSAEVEKEYAPLKGKLPAIIVYTRGAAPQNDDVITLEPLSSIAFQDGVKAMGLVNDVADRYARESGRSLTVLRRRLSGLPNVQAPEWAANVELAAMMVPFMLAGRWKVGNADDESVLSTLAGGLPYAELETRIAALSQLDDAPVWRAGLMRGLVSKVDVLFAIHRNVTHVQLEQFYKVAQQVLSEDDPLLDLTEDDRLFSLASFGLGRKYSSELRYGIGETLVLLAIYGQDLFPGSGAMDMEAATRRLIRQLLTPLTHRKLAANKDDLPLYAEASPEQFLAIIEADLESENPAVIELLKPLDSGMFGRCDRTGLLWALEGLAWNSSYLSRVVEILARLAVIPLNDRWALKPFGSLQGIFQCVGPQTSANLEYRLKILATLAERHPTIAWPLLVQQFIQYGFIGHLGHRPNWRDDGNGFGYSTKTVEVRAFQNAAIEMALLWSAHTWETLADLADNALSLSAKNQRRLWDIIRAWAKTATDKERVALRERIRVGCMTYRAKLRQKASGAPALSTAPLEQLYKALTPKDIVLDYGWLFKAPWVDHSANETSDLETDYHEREARITADRMQALQAVMKARSVQGVIDLASGGQAGAVIGRMLCDLITGVEEQVALVRACLAQEKPDAVAAIKLLLAGFFDALPEERLKLVLASACQNNDDVAGLLVLAPFRPVTWQFIDAHEPGAAEQYWKQAWFGIMNPPPDEMALGVDKLLAAGRPRAAFSYANFHLQSLNAKQLYQMLFAILTSTEPDGVYRLESYRIEEAFTLLNKSTAISQDELALLEFQYLEALERSTGIPNLEAVLKRRPEMFAEAVSLAFKSENQKADIELAEDLPESVITQRAMAGYRLLERCSIVPGMDDTGSIDSKQLMDWISKVRAICKETGHEKVGDFRLGVMLSHAPPGSNGIWPAEAISEAIESIWTASLSEGLYNGLYNSRGAHWRPDNGDPERDLVAKYQKWVDAHELRYPRLANTLREMVATYKKQADMHDRQGQAGRRLRR